jgi:hypothetical protein
MNLFGEGFKGGAGVVAGRVVEALLQGHDVL